MRFSTLRQALFIVLMLGTTLILFHLFQKKAIQAQAQVFTFLRLIGQTAVSGSSVTVPIELESRGDVSAVSFSLKFNPAILTVSDVSLSSQASSLGATLLVDRRQADEGRLGLATLFAPENPPKRYPQGSLQLFLVKFKVMANAVRQTTIIEFSNQPFSQLALDINNRELLVGYAQGSVVIGQAFEADVALRPNGDGGVSVTDWAQVGRFIAGLDKAGLGSEFQRADCAPRDTLGNGSLTTTDWVQAGRYAAGIDPIVAAGGPTAPSSFSGSSFSSSNASPDQAVRAVRIVSGNLERGQDGQVFVEIDALGGENALGFSLSFDPAQLRFVTALAGIDATNATINVNTAQSANGRIGVLLALPSGQTFSVGARRLVALSFSVVAAGNPIATTIGFVDLPVARELSDANAKVLLASYAGALVNVTRTAASVSAASFSGNSLAPESITAAFGGNLATTVQIASGLPLPTAIAGTTVKVKDNLGVERLAPLFFVAPTQVNYLIPAETAAGTATITITSGDGTVSSGQVAINSVAPGLFSANASGQGIAAATVLRVKADGSLGYEPVSRFDSAQGKVVPVPIDLGPEGDQVYLLLFGTGCRQRSSLSAVTLELGGIPAETAYVGPQGDFVGLDQINLRLPRSFAGRGDFQIKLRIDGKVANPVTVSIK